MGFSYSETLGMTSPHALAWTVPQPHHYLRPTTPQLCPYHSFEGFYRLWRLLDFEDFELLPIQSSINLLEIFKSSAFNYFTCSETAIIYKQLTAVLALIIILYGFWYVHFQVFIRQVGTHTQDKTDYEDDTIHNRIPRTSRSEYAAQLHTRITEVECLTTTVMSDYKLSI